MKLLKLAIGFSRHKISGLRLMSILDSSYSKLPLSSVTIMDVGPASTRVQCFIAPTGGLTCWGYRSLCKTGVAGRLSSCPRAATHRHIPPTSPLAYCGISNCNGRKLPIFFFCVGQTASQMLQCIHCEAPMNRAGEQALDVFAAFSAS